jgi:hypothetical protein
MHFSGSEVSERGSALEYKTSEVEANTLYIDSLVVFDKISTLRYNGEGESVLHLMPLSMVRRLDPLLNDLLCNSYGIVNLLMEGRVCMYKVDSSKACISNYCL